MDNSGAKIPRLKRRGSGSVWWYGDHTSYSPCNPVHSVQDEDTVTMTMVTIVDSDGITTAFSAFLPRLARNLLQGVTLSSHCSGELCRPGLVAAALQCDARGSHSVCYNLQYLLHSTAATDGGCSMAPPGSRMSGRSVHVTPCYHSQPSSPSLPSTS